jgi:hypothetical protein
MTLIVRALYSSLQQAGCRWSAGAGTSTMLVIFNAARSLHALQESSCRIQLF